MSTSPLYGSAPVAGWKLAPAFDTSTDGNETGSVFVYYSAFTGTWDEANGYCQLVPSPLVAYGVGGSRQTLIDLWDTTLAIVEVDVLSYEAANIGPFETGANPRRKYGSIGFWNYENFLGWKEISRTRNRYNIYSGDFSNSSFISEALFNSFVYVFGSAQSVSFYASWLASYMGSAGMTTQTQVTEVTWALTPGVTIRLKGWNACSGLVRVYET